MLNNEKIIIVTIDIVAAPLRAATHAYASFVSDTRSNVFFPARIKSDIDYSVEVGSFLWGSSPRGKQSFGVIELVNIDGIYDQYVGNSLRGKIVTIELGYTNTSIDTFVLCRTLKVDRIEHASERAVNIYVVDITADLEVPIQNLFYDTTASNQSVRGTPKPITFGRCYQAPFVQPIAFGNGTYDLHDNINFVGVEQALDQGISLSESVGFERSKTTGTFGIERLSAVRGKQCATVAGAFKILSTEVSDDFASLASWAENNGGAVGRDVTLSGGGARFLNTLGGADLSLNWNASTPTGTDATLWFFEFDCTAYTSGFLNFCTETGNVIHRKILALGKYSGIVRAQANCVPNFTAKAASNCDLIIDNFRLRKVSLMNKLSDLMTYACTNDASVGGKGPLSLSDLDAASITALETATQYSIGFHAKDPIRIADLLDQVFNSHASFWFANRFGKIQVGQIKAPGAVASFELNTSNIKKINVYLDRALGLRNSFAGKKNWVVYAESELATSLQYVALNAIDKDADITVSNSGYSYSCANVGSIRSVPGFVGDRYYFEIKIDSLSGATAGVGVCALNALVTAQPGASASCIVYRADGQAVVDNVASAFGSAFVVNDIIGVCLDGRAAQQGSQSRGFKSYFFKNGAAQGGANPALETGFVCSAINSKGIAHLLAGAGAAGNSGTVNLGQSSFAFTPPNDYVAPSQHKNYVTSEYRFVHKSATVLHPTYSSSINSDYSVSLLVDQADIIFEGNRIAALFQDEKYFYDVDAFIDSSSVLLAILGDDVKITYPRFGLSAGKFLKIFGIKGRILNNIVTLKVWG